MYYGTKPGPQQVRYNVPHEYVNKKAPRKYPPRATCLHFWKIRNEPDCAAAGVIIDQTPPRDDSEERGVNY